VSAGLTNYIYITLPANSRYYELLSTGTPLFGALHCCHAQVTGTNQQLDKPTTEVYLRGRSRRTTDASAGHPTTLPYTHLFQESIANRPRDHIALVRRPWIGYDCAELNEPVVC
jgi:hypothetical protein